MDYDDILTRFDVRQRSHESCQCICPCHNDRKASLSVSHRDHRTLLYCHAGCATADILQAVGLTMRNLFDEEADGTCTRRKAGRKREVPGYRIYCVDTAGQEAHSRASGMMRDRKEYADGA